MTNPMRATIVPSDSFCSVDGVGFNGVDMSSVLPEVHAVQWYATRGEVEIVDVITRKPIRNDEILDLSGYSAVFDSYWEIRNAFDEAQAAADAEAQIVEI